MTREQRIRQIARVSEALTAFVSEQVSDPTIDVALDAAHGEIKVTTEDFGKEAAIVALFATQNKGLTRTETFEAEPEYGVEAALMLVFAI